jgi:penicillin-binding protein 1A
MLLKKMLSIFWWLFAAGLLLAILIFTLIANGKIGYMPPIEELENPKNTILLPTCQTTGSRF